MKSNKQRINIKEAFREQAICAGVADDCVIDKNSFARISGISGCFNDGSTWIVYNTDERAWPYGIERHDSEVGAFIDLARRLNFNYVQPQCTLYSMECNTTETIERRRSIIARKTVGYPCHAFRLPISDRIVRRRREQVDRHGTKPPKKEKKREI